MWALKIALDYLLGAVVSNKREKMVPMICSLDIKAFEAGELDFLWMVAFGDGESSGILSGCPLSILFGNNKKKKSQSPKVVKLLRFPWCSSKGPSLILESIHLIMHSTNIHLVPIISLVLS